MSNRLIISKTDFGRLSSLIEHSPSSDIADLLDEELNRASIVEDSELPDNVVSMNSTVSFMDRENNKVSEITLVYPHQADIDRNHISIMTPVGSALIGLQVGQSIEWPFPSGRNRMLEVISVSSSKPALE